MLAVKAVLNAIRTSLVSHGMDKILIQAANGEVTITNDGATILKQMNVVHSATKMLVEKKLKKPVATTRWYRNPFCVMRFSIRLFISCIKSKFWSLFDHFLTTRKKCMSVLLNDGTEKIKLTIFGEQAEMANKLISLNKSYKFSGVYAKVVNPKYISINKNRTELLIEGGFKIEVVDDSIAHVMKFTLLDQVNQEFKENHVFNVLAVTKEKSDHQLKKAGSEEPLRKRVITLLDESLCVMELQLFNDQIERIPYEKNLVIAFHNLTLKEFNGKKSLRFMSDTFIEINPANLVTNQLKNLEIPESSTTTSQVKAIKTLNENVKIVDVKNAERSFYMQCPRLNCNKKVTCLDDAYFCSKCNVKYVTFKYQLWLQLVGEFNNEHYSLTTFHDESCKILQMTELECAFMHKYNKEALVARVNGLKGQMFNFQIKLNETTSQMIVTKVDDASQDAKHEMAFGTDDVDDELLLEASQNVERDLALKARKLSLEANLTDGTEEENAKENMEDGQKKETVKGKKKDQKKEGKGKGNKKEENPLVRTPLRRTTMRSKAKKPSDLRKLNLR